MAILPMPLAIADSGDDANDAMYYIAKFQSHILAYFHTKYLLRAFDFLYFGTNKFYNFFFVKSTASVCF